MQSTPDLWFTSWRDGHSEYAFEFKYFEGIEFKITTYDVGAYEALIFLTIDRKISTRMIRFILNL